MNGTNGYELHPLCTLFPRLSGAEFETLRDDVKVNGLRQPIVLHDGMILDGGNRYRACLDAGVKPSFVEFSGGNLVSFVLSANLHRRHMSPGQQAAIVASATDWAKAQTHGGDRRSDQVELVPLETVGQRAAASGASEKTQRKADALVREAPALADQVRRGEKTLYRAVKESKPSKILPRPQAQQAEDDPLEKAREHAKKQNAAIRSLRKELAEKDALIESLRGDLIEARTNAAELADSLTAYMKADEGEESVAKEIKRLMGQIKAIEATRDQYMTQNAEMKRTLAARDRKIAKLESAV